MQQENSAMNFLKKFSTKKDALIAISILIDNLNKSCFECKGGVLDEDHWQKLKTEIESFQDIDLSQQVLDFLNQQYGTQYKNTDKIKAIIRQIPKVTFDQFASIIMHKKETWGKDPKMVDYLRPATLFGSKNKFQTYLEDATHYWIKKQQHDITRKI
jgi:uncharacterized phage protein (TIGR02220 family)